MAETKCVDDDISVSLETKNWNFYFLILHSHHSHRKKISQKSINSELMCICCCHGCRFCFLSKHINCRAVVGHFRFHSKLEMDANYHKILFICGRIQPMILLQRGVRANFRRWHWSWLTVLQLDSSSQITELDETMSLFFLYVKVSSDNFI